MNLSRRIAEVNIEAKWRWMMDYCKKNQLPPAQSWAWSRAEKAWLSAFGGEGEYR